MFGYVKTNNAELKVKEYELYRATYCGLCKSMGKCTGQCSRMTLNYDFVFLVLVRLALSEQKTDIKQKRCFVHPFKKRNCMANNPVLSYCAGASAILNYQKVVDDLNDENGARKLRARLALPFVAHSRKKAFKKDPLLKTLDESVSERLRELSSQEKNNSASVDIPANCFGKLLGEIMSFGFEGADARIAYELGRNIGAWIYIADAIDDMREDMEKGRYNPFIKLYDGKLPDAEQLESISYAIKNHLYGAEAAVDLIQTEHEAIKNIIQNIIYLGIPERTDGIIKDYTTEKSGKERTDD